MQKYFNNQILYSPSDLVNFLGCQHSIFYDLKFLNKNITKSRVSNIAHLLQKKGLEHEISFLAQMRTEGKQVYEVPKYHNLEDRARMTLRAIKSGIDIIYQAVFISSPWRGDADFLVKCDKVSSLGSFSYEVLDTKLTNTPHPKHIIQLCLYSEMLASVQNLLPSSGYLFLGNNKKYSFQLNNFRYYFTLAKKRFEAYMDNVPLYSYPEPCKHCNFCPWNDKCKDLWLKDGHLSLVSNIQRSQINTLRNFGIHTLSSLAAAKHDMKIPGLSIDTFSRLRLQAILQYHKENTGENKFKIIQLKPGKGFARIPIPDEGDLFFDIEGDPLYPEGLEYLLGVYYFNEEKKIFKPFWAHSHNEEKKTFKKFMCFLSYHLLKYPNAYIYHYNHYETTALKKLACRHTTCEEELDNLLRNGKFIDLYCIVRESLCISEPGYSIKNLETFYMEKRANIVATAAESIIVYNEWRQTKVCKLLKEIADYNRVDCISTQLLRNWLIKLKPNNISFAGYINYEDGKNLQRKDWEIQYEEFKNRLSINIGPYIQIKKHLSDLLEFHNREAKSVWWGRFERQNKLEHDLIDDADCIGGLKLISYPKKYKRSLIYTYRFPPQEYKLKAGDKVFNTATIKNIGTILLINNTSATIQIKKGISSNFLPKSLSIGPDGPIDTGKIRTSIYCYAHHILKNTRSLHPVTELLQRNMPRIQGRKQGAPIISSHNIYEDILDAIMALENSYLFIQGPPGAGKTYISGNIILDLIKSGKKIGVNSNSHKAIHNLLERIERLAIQQGIKFRGVKKSTSNKTETIFDGEFISSESKISNIDLTYNLFAGTAWTFSDPHFNNYLDYLFIDEAGQVSIANVVAMSKSAKSIILVGDQMQLGQPIQAVHPREAGLSVLEFLLKNYQTIPAERGVFLDQTYRMHPNICKFISNTFYDGRLTAHQSTLQRHLKLKDLDIPNAGIIMISVKHEGCSQKSTEEGNIIKQNYQALIGQEFKDIDGISRVIIEDDILVITPYNIQVNFLRSILPSGAKVGTIDKFQGQEAPIVLISMVTSGVEYFPRNIEFLYSKNRLNVAVSRAQCLTIIIINPKLLEIPCTTVDQMTLVNTFCRLNEYSKRFSTKMSKSIDKI